MSNVSSSNLSTIPDAPPEPPKPAWGPLAAVLVTVGAFVGSQLGVGLLAYLALGIAGWPTHRITDWIDNSTFGQFIVLGIAEVVFVVSIWWFLRWRHTNLKALGYGRGLRWKDLGYALVGFAVYFILLIVCSRIAGALLH